MYNPNKYLPPAPPVYIRKELYWFSLIVLTVNIVWAISLMFIGNPIEWATPQQNQSMPMFLIIFVALLIETAASGNFSRQERPHIPKEQLEKLDYILIGVNKIAIAGFILPFLATMIAGGHGEVIDGMYYITSHGDIVREISREYLYFLAYCERWLFSGGLIFFTSHVTLLIRAQYVLQGSTKTKKIV